MTCSRPGCQEAKTLADSGVPQSGNAVLVHCPNCGKPQPVTVSITERQNWRYKPGWDTPQEGDYSRDVTVVCSVCHQPVTADPDTENRLEDDATAALDRMH